ncbi:MAG: carbohydrate diacid regulator [Clostridia bacterium]|jgi:carbohydrate diacid regulator|nr:carbohydrate diacid regulator [Clostridia bacterium]MDN5322183.1 carbohydrate diacid regulator [Clostridia bacterium]
MLQLSHPIAQEVAIIVSSLIGYSIAICNRNGSIIGTTEYDRFNKFNQGAYEAIKTGKEIIISTKNINKFEGAKLGINLPLKLNNQIIGAVEIAGDPNRIKIHGKLTKMTVETMIKAALMEKQTSLESRALENFLYTLLYEQLDETEQSLRERASLLGIDLKKPRIAIVIHIQDFQYVQIQKEKVLKCIKFVLNGNDQYLSAYTGGNNFVVFVPIIPTSENFEIKKNVNRISKTFITTIKKQLGLESVIGIGSLNNKSYYSLKTNFQEACEALSTGNNFKKERNIYFFDELGLDLILNNIPQKVADNFLKNIIGDKEKSFDCILDSTLLYTLEVFFECNLNISETARILFVHRNTLLYRLDKIFKITKRDPRIFSEAMELKILLLLKHSSSLKENQPVMNVAIQ